MNQSSSANEKKISSPDSSEVFDASPSKTYHEQAYIDQTLRLREILKTLPAFTKDYFRAVEPTTSARTRISYAYDIRVFFHFLMEVNPHYKNYTIDQFTVQDLERLDPVDIEEYQEYLKSIRMKKIVRSQILKKDFPVKCLHSAASTDIILSVRSFQKILPYWLICQNCMKKRSYVLIRTKSPCFLTM